MTLILDMGSGNSCHNDRDTITRMIDAVAAVDSRRHRVILKWQLFACEPPNVPLWTQSFEHAYWHAVSLGYETTASVFDRERLRLLLAYNEPPLGRGIPFVKIACRPDLYRLIDEVPRGLMVYVSTNTDLAVFLMGYAADQCIQRLLCVRKYPATTEDYIHAKWKENAGLAISDHTIGWDLFRQWQPKIIEKHFRLPDATGPDAGPFAVTPDELKEIM